LEFLADVIVHFLQFAFRTELYERSIFFDPNSMAGRPIEDLSSSTYLFFAVLVPDVNSTFEDITPVWTLAFVIR
jgi:hypothetical protein